MSTATSLQRRLMNDLQTTVCGLQHQLELIEMETRAEEIRLSHGAAASLDWLRVAYSDEDLVLDRQWRKSLPAPS